MADATLPEIPLPPLPEAAAPQPEPSLKPEAHPPDQKDLVAPRTPLPPKPEPVVSVTEHVTVPSYGRWFSFDGIHDVERRMVSEFFDGRSAAKNPRVYIYLRDFIVNKYRENPARKITFTEVRRMLVADVGSIRRVFDFLESWGLINYVPSKQSLRSEEKDKSSTEPAPSLTSSSTTTASSSSPAMMSESARLSSFFNPIISGEIGVDQTRGLKDGVKKWCSRCKSACNSTCFDCRKADVILCARCFVRGNYQVGLSAADFKRLDLTVVEETKKEWTDEETLRLLEAILQYKDDWRMVSDHVGSRTEKECIARFVKLPIGEQYMQPLGMVGDCKDAETRSQTEIESRGESNGGLISPTKRTRLTPLADASNPIMAQAAFLSALVGSDVASAAARAAIAALYPERTNPLGGDASMLQAGAAETNGGIPITLDEAFQQAHAELNKEEQDVEQYLANFIEVKLKRNQDTFLHFEEQELLIEKERAQLDHMKNVLFADQMSFLQRISHARSSDSSRDDGAKVVLDIS